jgi:hypothetical protein
MKPGDFHIGVIDFFSVLLPGALLAGMIAIVLPMPPALMLLLDSETAKWIAFALAAYALGHFVFLISAELDRFYDSYRRRRWPDADGPGKPFKEATALRCRHFANGCEAEEDLPMNTFKWAKSVLMVRAPAALADVNRYEADSKFFRSMALVLPVVAIVCALSQLWPAALLALSLAFMSFLIYAQQRYKSTEWAYQYLLVLDRLGELRNGPRRPEKPATEGSAPE